MYLNERNLKKHFKHTHKDKLLRDVDLQSLRKYQAVPIVLGRKKQKQRVVHLSKDAEEKRKKALEVLQKSIIDGSTAFYVIWDNVSFAKDKLIFSTSNLTIHPLQLRGVHEGLNIIKKEYFLRLFGDKVYKLQQLHGRILIELSRDWVKFISVIEFAKNHYDFKVAKSSKIGVTLSKTVAHQIFLTSREKKVYLQYLAQIQDDQFGVTPILEVNGSRKEESLIFRVRTKHNKILVIWENIYDGRASHMFLTDPASHDSDLLKIFGFILSNTPEKRSLLHGGYLMSEAVRKNLNYLSNVLHDTLEEYISKVERIVYDN